MTTRSSGRDPAHLAGGADLDGDAGDIDGDGMDDVVFGSPLNDDRGTNAGKIGFRYGPVVGRSTMWLFGAADDTESDLLRAHDRVARGWRGGALISAGE